MPDPAAFQEHRSLLLGLAYRMLGSVDEAEDAVQDCYVRWSRVDHGAITSPRAWLVTTTSRLCIDRLRRLKRERQIYEGPWVPEPWVEPDPADEAAGAAMMARSLRLAFLIVMEHLSPTERAAFLLRDVFGVRYAEIASILDRTEVASRKLVSRARKALRERQTLEEPEVEAPESAPGAEERDLAAAFFQASMTGDLEELKSFLAQDVELWSDGGGKVVAAREVLAGPDRVGRFLIGLRSHAADGQTLDWCRINGGPGVLIRAGAEVTSAVSIEFAAGRAHRILIQRNPDKLKHLTPPEGETAA